MKRALKCLLNRVRPSVWLEHRTQKARSWSLFREQFEKFRIDSAAGGRFTVEWKERMPSLDDKTGFTEFDHHYVFHTAWAARMVAAARPALHIDISSSLYFCSIVSAFVPVDFYDYRPAVLNLDGLSSRCADLMALPFADGSVESISCMHVIEHVGLGRYGDPLDPDGDLKAMEELRRVLAPGWAAAFRHAGRQAARGIQRAPHQCNAANSRCVSGLQLKEFSLVPDSRQQGLVRNAPFALADGQEYGCGCFCFSKEDDFDRSNPNE